MAILLHFLVLSFSFYFRYFSLSSLLSVLLFQFIRLILSWCWFSCKFSVCHHVKWNKINTLKIRKESKQCHIIEKVFTILAFPFGYTGSLGFLGQTNNQLSASIWYCIPTTLSQHKLIFKHYIIFFFLVV